MSVSVADMARITSYVAAKAPIERYLKVSNFSEEDEVEVRKVWAEVESDMANLKPGDQMMLPNEWS